jgi:hypothetical protein
MKDPRASLQLPALARARREQRCHEDLSPEQLAEYRAKGQHVVVLPGGTVVLIHRYTDDEDLVDRAPSR